MSIQAPPQAESQRQRLRTIGAWLFTAPWAIWALARLFGLETGAPFVQLMAFTPYVAAMALIPVAVALVARQWWAAGVAGLACLILAGSVLPRAVGSASTMEGVPITVMSVNMLEGGADPQAIVDVVRARKVDVLTIQEFTPRAERRLAAAGLEALLPYQQLQPMDSTPGSALYSRYPITGADARQNEGSFYQAFATVHLPGAPPVEVTSVHPVAPATASALAPWAQDLRDEPPATVGGGPGGQGGRVSNDGPLRILAGDFNATLDHAELRRLLDTGYADAAAAVGAGLTPTWPYFGQRSSITPKVTLDHVFADSRIGVRGFAAYPIPQTDHRAVVAELTLPRT